jgi:hypothetical protein
MSPDVLQGWNGEAAKLTGLVLPTKVRAALATLPSDFTGKIEINCFKGGVGNMNIAWSVKTD